MKSLFVLIPILVLSLTTVAMAQSAKPQPAPGDAADGKALMTEARKAAHAVQGKKSAERTDAIRQAIQAYEVVRTRCAKEPEFSGEAAFRIAELHLRLKESDKAVTAFEAAFKETREKFGARALIEIAHVIRRAHKLDDAIAAYSRVEKEFPGDTRAVDSRMWIGRAEMERKAWDKARESFQQVARDAKDPVDRVEALDWTARSFLRESRLDDAQLVLDAADKEFHELTAGSDRDAPRVRKALERMGARESLARARARLQEDSQKAEKDARKPTGTGKK